MGLTLMVILFIGAVVAIGLMISRLTGKGRNRANDPEAGSRPGVKPPTSSNGGNR